MASMTKEELRNALISHNVPVPPTSAKKDELVQLYEENISPSDAGEFSADEDLPKSSDKKRVSRTKLSSSSRKSTGSSKTNSPKKLNKSDANETDEDIEINVDIEGLEDDHLFEMLKKNGVSAGPIVKSTRKFYEKKLRLVLNGGTNGVNEKEFSDTEPEGDEEEEDDQPAGQVIHQTRSSRSKAPPSPVSQSGLRHRMNLADELDSSNNSFASPRRAISSYTVTETTRHVTTRAKDGTEVVDTNHSVERTQSSGSGGSPKQSFFSRIIYPLIKLLILVILGVGLYVVFTTPSDGVTPVDKVIESINNAVEDIKVDTATVKEVPPTVKEVPQTKKEVPPVIEPTRRPVVKKPVVDPLPEAGNIVDV